MNPQLETLLQIQDLKAQRRELQGDDETSQFQSEEFGLDLEQAVTQLDGKISEVEGELDPQTRSRYTRLANSMHRVVVPAINGICYGCFVAVPTAVASDPAQRKAVNNCAHCGRFLYFID